MPFPPLPPISAELELDVFTHKGLRASPSSLREDDSVVHSDWERLAFLGDAVLQICVTDWLFFSYPHSKIGDLTVKRARIVSNKTLGSWSTAYKLPERIIAHPSNVFQLRNMSSDKIRGSLFEAYLAAVYRSGDNGVVNARKWIEAILQFEEGEGEVPSDSERNSNASETNVEDDTDSVEFKMGNTNTMTPSKPPRVPTTPDTVSAAAQPTESKQTVASKASTAPKQPKGFINYISAFNERAAQRNLHPEWSQNASGPDHQMKWQAALEVSGQVFRATGGSIKEARNLAAKEAWYTLNWG